MARELSNGVVEVQVKPTLICIVGQGVSGALVKNVSDTVVFVGGSGVAADGNRQGYPLDPGESQTFPAFEHDSTGLYAVISGDDEKQTARVVFVVSS